MNIPKYLKTLSDALNGLTCVRAAPSKNLLQTSFEEQRRQQQQSNINHIKNALLVKRMKWC